MIPDAPFFQGAGSPAVDAIDQSQLIPGSDSAETLTGTDEDDAIFAEDGDDTIIGTAGNDFINGEGGSDTADFSDFGEAVTLRPSPFFDEEENVQLFNIESVIGAAGQSNTIDGSAVSSALQVDLDNNSLFIDGIVVPNPGLTREIRLGSVDLEIVNFNRVIGSQIADTITGDDAANNLFGGDGDDTILGGGGRDRINGGRGNDTIEGGSLRDVLRGRNGEDNISGDEGDDLIFGGAGGDLLNGGTGDDRFFGGTGDDRIVGGTGDDFIVGDVGSDFLLGEAGADTFLLETGDGTDSISDFVVGEDFIGLVEGDLTFGALDISQSGSLTIVEVADTGELLANLADVNADDLTADSFVTVPLAI